MLRTGISAAESNPEATVAQSVQEDIATSDETSDFDNIPIDRKTTYTASFVISKQQNIQDITAQYTDNDSRIAVLEERKNRLMIHLQNATDTEEIIMIENQIAEVISELEQLQGNKHRMDILLIMQL